MNNLKIPFVTRARSAQSRQNLVSRAYTAAAAAAARVEKDRRVCDAALRRPRIYTNIASARAINHSSAARARGYMTTRRGHACAGLFYLSRRARKSAPRCASRELGDLWVAGINDPPKLSPLPDFGFSRLLSEVDAPSVAMFLI